MSKNVEKLIEGLSKKDKKIKEFGDLLGNLSSTEDKKKMLWREVYENALIDRENANMLFSDLLIKSRNNVSNHQVYGPLMSKYLERMSKSNDQILRLAELVSKEETTKTVSVDDIFNQIEE
jgi:hypothetical protein